MRLISCPQSTTRAHTRDRSRAGVPRRDRRIVHDAGRSACDYRGESLKLAAMLFSPDGARELSESMEETLTADFAPSAAEDAGKRWRKKCLRAAPALCLGNSRLRNFSDAFEEAES